MNKKSFLSQFAIYENDSRIILNKNNAQKLKMGGKKKRITIGQSKK